MKFASPHAVFNMFIRELTHPQGYDYDDYVNGRIKGLRLIGICITTHSLGRCLLKNC